MPNTEEDQASDSSVDADLLREIFQGKWRLQILRQMVDGPVRLSELRRRLPRCGKKVMIDSLHSLEKLAWVERREFASRIKKVQYSLASSHAEALIRVLDKLQRYDLL